MFPNNVSILLAKLFVIFKWGALDEADTLVLLASGLGIAAFLPFIHKYRDEYSNETNKRQMLFLYFNKTKADILWHLQLVEANMFYPWFQLFLIIEEPDTTWENLIGPITPRLLKWCMKAIPGACTSNKRVICLASGESEFLKSCGS